MVESVSRFLVAGSQYIESWDKTRASSNFGPPGECFHTNRVESIEAANLSLWRPIDVDRISPVMILYLNSDV